MKGAGLLAEAAAGLGGAGSTGPLPASVPQGVCLQQVFCPPVCIVYKVIIMIPVHLP